MRLRVLLATTTALVVAPMAAHAQWDLRTSATLPSGRTNAAMTWDPVSGSVVLFGGSTSLPAPSSQTWSWNGSSWALLAPASSPSGRYGVEMVHDTVRGVCVLYGGWTSAIAIGMASDQTWEWNGATWTQASPSTNPGSLFNYALAFDAARGRTVLYGGNPSLAFPLAQNGTWEYDGTNWTQVTPAGNPGPLERASMCFHAGTGKVVLFGGVDSTGGGNDTTWLYDGANWTAAAVAGSRPPPRSGANIVHDPIRDVCILTSGMQPGTGQRLSDTWEWNGTVWTQQPTTTTGVLDGCLAFLPTTRQTVKFGGLASSTPFALNGETWEFGAKRGSFGLGCAGQNGVPLLTAVDAPRLGQNYTVNLTNMSVTSTLGILYFGFFPLPGVDLGFVGMPTCKLFTTPIIIFNVPGTGGSATWVWPNVTGTVGDTFYGQAACLDPSANPLGYTTSNAISARVGN